MSGFKTNSIKLHLVQKLQAWVSTIRDAALVERIKADTIVSGGAIASMLLGEKVNDYDIYFRTRATAKAVAEYYVRQFNATKGHLAGPSLRGCNPEVRDAVRKNAKGIEENRVTIFMKSSGVASETQSEYKYFENQPELSADQFMDGLKVDTNPIDIANELATIVKDRENLFRPVFFSENAITLSNKVQLVIRFWGEPDELHENYDFAHAMCYFDWGRGTLKLHSDASEALLSKTLLYRGSLYPIASLFRIRKFIERGWRISAGQMLTIIWQIGELDLKDPFVLREQLLGVDQAYFHQLLRALETKDSSQRVDATYIAKLVDEIFE